MLSNRLKSLMTRVERVHRASSVLLILGSYLFFQAEDGIRYLVRSRGLGDVYKRQRLNGCKRPAHEWLADARFAD